MIKKNRVNWTIVFLWTSKFINYGSYRFCREMVLYQEAKLEREDQRLSVRFLMQAISGILRVKINDAYVIMLNFWVKFLSSSILESGILRLCEIKFCFQISLNVFKDSY